MRKTLVYYFYCTRENVFNEINCIHFECLRRYNKIFNDIKFCISINDTNDKQLIKEVQSKILEIFDNNFEKISFIIYKNEPNLCECNFFYNEIISKLDEYDLVFFGHNKGFLSASEKQKYSLYHWSIGMYYYSLEFMDEVELYLGKQYNGLFYGSFLREDENTETLYNKHYMGTYFWINCQQLKQNIGHLTYKSVKPYSRFYAENYPGNIIETNLYSHLNRKIYHIDYDIYSHFPQVIQELYPEEKNFYYIYNNILNMVNTKK